MVQQSIINRLKAVSYDLFDGVCLLAASSPAVESINRADTELRTIIFELEEEVKNG